MNPNSPWNITGNNTPDPEAAILRDLQDAKASVARAEKALVAMREAKNFPTDPSGAHKMFTMKVRFPMNPKVYTFMLIEAGGFWYTTGTSNETKVFRGWKTLVKWVREETVGKVTLYPVYTAEDFRRTDTGCPAIILSK